MSMDRVINLLVTITLIEMMIAIGLGVALTDLILVARDWRLLIRALVANYLCVPAVTVGLLLLFHAQPMVAVGFLILAVCPGAPYGPPFAAIARSNVAVAVGLMVVLAGSSALVAPFLLQFLVGLISVGEPLQVDAIRMAVTLLVTQLLPLCFGVALRSWRPALAIRLQGPANLLSKLLNLLAVGLVLTVQFHLFLEIKLHSLLGMLGLLVASWAAGWLLGGSSSDTRKVMTLTTSLRNVGVGLVIATGGFAGTSAVTAVLIYGLFEVLGSLLLALVWARHGKGELR